MSTKYISETICSTLCTNGLRATLGAPWDLTRSCQSFWMTSFHYNDVMTSAIAYQINGLTIVYSTVYSDADQRKHQSSVSLAFVRGIHRWPVNSPHKGPVTRKVFPFDPVIMGMVNTRLTSWETWTITYAYGWTSNLRGNINAVRVVIPAKQQYTFRKATFFASNITRHCNEYLCKLPRRNLAIFFRNLSMFRGTWMTRFI